MNSLFKPRPKKKPVLYPFLIFPFWLSNVAAFKITINMDIFVFSIILAHEIAYLFAKEIMRAWNPKCSSEIVLVDSTVCITSTTAKTERYSYDSWYRIIVLCVLVATTYIINKEYKMGSYDQNFLRRLKVWYWARASG
jgi:hypothetical protein